MKTFQTILFAASFALVSNFSNAQLMSASATIAESNAAAESRLSASTEASMKAAAKLNKANLKAVAHFNRDFKTTRNEKWTIESNVISATFNEGDVKNYVVYTKKGNWLRTMKIYQPADIPGHIRDLMRHSEYKDYSITLVQEIEEAAMKFFVIHVDNGRQVKLLTLADGEIGMYKEFDKQQ